VRASKSFSRSVRARVLLAVMALVALAISSAGPAEAAPAHRRAHQPDLLLGDFQGSCCRGLGLYEAWPYTQQLSESVKQGGYTDLMVPLYNGGTGADSFRIIGERSYGGVQVRYFRGLTGANDITSAVVDGRYVVSNLKPRDVSSTALRIRVTAPSADVGYVRTVRVIARVVGHPHAMDAGSFTVTVTN
jgi:hypothetical protein